MKVAILGDIHGRLDDYDVEWFNASDRDAILAVGDLSGRIRDAVAVAGRLARLERPTFVCPGNHDAAPLPAFAAELTGRPGISDRFAGPMAARYEELKAALAPATLAAYARFPLPSDEDPVELVVGRPHPMGGSALSYRRHLLEGWGVGSEADSVDRYAALVDAAEADQLVFLAHNGPTGLGGERDSIFGADFRPAGGDFGDSDLRAALDHARRRGKRVLACVSGHMHHKLKGGGGRRTRQLRGEDGVLYVNAARVPRIFSVAGRRSRRLHHHVLLTIEGGRADAEEVLV